MNNKIKKFSYFNYEDCNIDNNEANSVTIIKRQIPYCEDNNKYINMLNKYKKNKIIANNKKKSKKTPEKYINKENFNIQAFKQINDYTNFNTNKSINELFRFSNNIAYKENNNSSFVFNSEVANNLMCPSLQYQHCTP